MTEILKHRGSPAAEAVTAVVACEQGWPDEWVMHPLVAKELDGLHLLDRKPPTQYGVCASSGAYVQDTVFLGIRIKLDDTEPYSTTMKQVVEASLKHKKTHKDTAP
jgi:hypothetical protein